MRNWGKRKRGHNDGAYGGGGIGGDGKKFVHKGGPKNGFDRA